jgi:hypothetical protein
LQNEDEVFPEILFAEDAASVLGWINRNVQCVVAGTVWAVRKAFKERFTTPPGFSLFHFLDFFSLNVLMEI